MEKINGALVAETKVTHEVRSRVMKLFAEVGYCLSDDWENTFTLQIDPGLTTDASVKGNHILGKNPAALFQGAVRLLVRLLMGKALSGTIQPKLSERIVLLDVGRKYYSLNELKRLVRSMALFQFTHLQLHFSENEGFRLESRRHPEIVSAEYLTQAEVKELIAYAKQFYLAIIPDFDSPRHLQQVLRNYPQWQLPMTEEKRDARALNILNPTAVTFIKEIYQELAELFHESRYFHIGADEFIDFDQLESYPELKQAALARYGPSAGGNEKYIDYVNEIAAYLKHLGFTVRVWNDGFYRINRQEQVHLTKDCEISYWTRWNQSMAPIEYYIDQGYTVINHNDNFFYYVLGEAAGYSYPTYDKIQRAQLTTFADGQKINDLSQTKGVALSIWADKPEAKSAAEVLEDIFWLLAAMSEKMSGEELKKTDYYELFNHWSS